MSLLVADLIAEAPAWRLTAEDAQRIERGAPPGWEVRMIRATTISDGDGGTPPSVEVVEAIRDAEVYAGFGIARDLYLAAPRLKWVHSATAGVGSALFDEMREGDVVLTNSAGVHAIPMAEYVVGGVLYFMRGFDLAVQAQRAGEWARTPFTGEHSPLRELGGARALIVGAGGIGTEIARRLSALGVSCAGIRRRPDLRVPPGFDRISGPSSLDRELPSADIVVLAAPATAETRGLLSRERLGMLQKHAIVVNIARGSLLDEEALADQLDAGLLRGAVLDVTLREPLYPESRLWTLGSVLLTPHVAAVAPGAFWEREISLLLDNWQRYVRGETLRNVVDKQAGY